MDPKEPSLFLLKTGVIEGTRAEVQKLKVYVSYLDCTSQGQRSPNFPQIALMLYLPLGQVPGALSLFSVVARLKHQCPLV